MTDPQAIICLLCGTSLTGRKRKFCSRSHQNRWRLENGQAGGRVAQYLRGKGHPAYREVCGMCDGSGIVEQHKLFWLIRTERPCPECKGSGAAAT